MYEIDNIEVDERYVNLLLDSFPSSKSDFEEWLQRVESGDTVGELIWNIIYPFFNPMFPMCDCMAEKLIYELDEKLNEEERCRIVNSKERFINALKDEIQHME